MKTSRLVNLAMLCLAITMVSCSGDDGERGPQGPKGDSIAGDPGADGSDGTNCWDLNGNGMNDTDEDINNDGNFNALDCQGADGTNGSDGNANVQAFTYDITFFADYSQLDLDLFNIVDAPENYAYLFYIEEVGGTRYSIPGNALALPINVHVETFLPNGILTIRFFSDLNDAPFVVPAGLFAKVIVVAIELTNGAKNSDAPLADLKAAGVDTTDYNAVAAYLGLE